MFCRQPLLIKFKFTGKCLWRFVVSLSDRILTKWFNDVRNRFLTITAIAVIGMTTASCQLLIDNRKTGKTSVVVVPTDEWDTLRGQQMRPDIASDIAKEMAISIADELRTTQSANAVTTPAVDLPTEEVIMPAKHSAPTPIDGSQIIQFSNRTNSQLADAAASGLSRCCIQAQSTMLLLF